MQIVTSASFDGAEMMTCLDALREWREALSFDVKRPDDSTTISTPRSPQGISAGSGEEKTRSSLPSMVMLVLGVRRPRSESCVHRVVLQQIRERRRVGEIVDGHEFDFEIALERGAQHVAPDAPETIDSYPDH